jgi:heptosyltransferase III
MQLRPSFSHIKKILVIKLKHIGDVLLISPCIRALKDSFPEASISVLVNEGTEAMFLRHPLVSEVIVFPRKKLKSEDILGRIAGEAAFVSGVRKRRFDMSVDLTSGDRAAWISLISGARYRLAYEPLGQGFLGKRRFYTHLVPQKRDLTQHEVKKNLHVLEYHGIRTADPRLELHIAEADSEIVNQKLRSLKIDPNAGNRYFVVHPTSRWLFKCWDDGRFASLVGWLQQTYGHPVVLTCGPDPKELSRARTILSLCSDYKPRTLLGELTLTQWAALVKRADLFVGVDSAPMHIAASQGTPTLALFGPTGHRNWHPWGVRHTVLAHECPCSVDRQPHCDWKTTRACMMAISLEEARAACEQLLAPESANSHV